MVQWKHISVEKPPHPEQLYLYRDVEGEYGVGVYEADDHFFNPSGGEVKAEWWAEFNRVEEQ